LTITGISYNVTFRTPSLSSKKERREVLLSWDLGRGGKYAFIALLLLDRHVRA